MFHPASDLRQSQTLTWVRPLLKVTLVLLLVLSTWAIAPSAQAFNNPDLLPDQPTNVIDLAKLLTEAQEQTLSQDLADFEAETGWKLRVLTQFDRTPGTAVKQFWGLNEKSVMLVADQRGGNILNFSVGDALYPLLSRTFWIELQTRFGNQFFVRDNGEDESILQTISTLKYCLRQNGCSVVPGLPQEQWILTLVSSIVGGVVCGFAAHPRKEGQAFSWQWALIFSPLWGILFISFGIAPVVTRTSDWVPLVRNLTGFAMGVLVAYLTPMLGRSSASDL
jgi:TPM domain